MLAVIRIRGNIKVKPALRKTMELLRLHRTNHLVLVSEEQLPMVKKVQSFVTWGEPEEATIAKMLEKRARLPGNKKIDAGFLKKHSLGTFENFAKDILEGKKTLAEAGIKPVFRLKPPKKGFERQGIKKPYSIGGALGYRAADINYLIAKIV